MTYISHRDQSPAKRPPRRPARFGARTRRRFGKNERASVALMFALMLPILFGIIGLGVETGIWFAERRELQTMADAAAVSAAIENAYGATSAELTTAAQLEATNNGFDATTDTITYVGTPTSGAYAGDSGYIEVQVSRQLETILSQVFTSINPVTTARAVASTTGDQEACVLALSTTAMNSIYVNGAGTDVSMTGCGIVSNSTHSTKSINVQNGSFTAECLWAAGGIDGEENMNTSCNSPISDASAIDDPFASLSVPSYSSSGCLTGNGNNAYSPADGETLSEGVYCDGIDISANSTVTLNAGTYIIDEGNFTVNGGATVTGTDVTIILTASDGSGYGTISINGNGSVELSAPTAADSSGSITGDYTGILFYQDRDGPSSASMDGSITGGATVELTGAIYMPNNDLDFNGGSTADSNGCLMLVAQSISFSGDADINNECDMYGGNPITYGARPGLVE